MNKVYEIAKMCLYVIGGGAVGVVLALTEPITIGMAIAPLSLKTYLIIGAVVGGVSGGIIGAEDVIETRERARLMPRS